MNWIESPLLTPTVGVTRRRSHMVPEEEAENRPHSAIVSVPENEIVATLRYTLPEGLVPVPSTDTNVIFRFKFEYLYNTFGAEPKPGSDVSPLYNLKIVD